MTALIIFAILCFIFCIWYNVHLDKKFKAEGELTFLFLANGLWIISLIAIFLVHEEKITPKAIDVYRSNTELEIHSINGTPIDTVVVWKGGVKYDKN